MATLLEVHMKQLNSLLPHPPYSHDLAPSDYHLFDAIRDAVRGKHYGNNEEVKISVKNWLYEQPLEFYKTKIYAFI